MPFKEEDLLPRLEQMFPDQRIDRDKLQPNFYRKIQSIATGKGFTPYQYLLSLGYQVYSRRMTEPDVLRELKERYPDNKIPSRKELGYLNERLQYFARKKGMSLQEYLEAEDYVLTDAFLSESRRRVNYGTLTARELERELAQYITDGTGLVLTGLPRALYESLRERAAEQGLKPKEYVKQLGVKIAHNKQEIDWDRKMPEILRMRQGNKSYRDIGKRLGVSGQRIYQVLSQHGYEE